MHRDRELVADACAVEDWNVLGHVPSDTQSEKAIQQRFGRIVPITKAQMENTFFERRNKTKKTRIPVPRSRDVGYKLYLHYTHSIIYTQVPMHFGSQICSIFQKFSSLAPNRLPFHLS